MIFKLNYLSKLWPKMRPLPVWTRQSAGLEWWNWMGRRSFIHLFVCLYISFECFIIIIILVFFLIVLFCLLDRCNRRLLLIGKLHTCGGFCKLLFFHVSLMKRKAKQRKDETQKQLPQSDRWWQMTHQWHLIEPAGHHVTFLVKQHREMFTVNQYRSSK